MSEFSIELNICHCRRLNRDSVKDIAELLFSNGFTLLMSTKGKLSRIDTKAGVSELIQAHLRVSDTVGYADQSSAWSLLFRTYPSQMRHFDNSVFEVQYRGSEQNRLTITGLFDLAQEDQRGYVAPYAEMLRQVAIDAYSILQPTLSVVDNDTKIQDAWNITGSDLKVISWLNLWGPSYISKYGREFLMGMPGHKTGSLEDGGIWHQLSDTITTTSYKGAEELRMNVINYCAARNFNIACYAPYMLVDKSTN